MKKIQRITYYERQIIESGLRCSKSLRQIARQLNRNPGVIQREVKRNSGDCLPYTALEAQKIHERRKAKTNKRKLEKEENNDLREYVVEKIEDDWSPEQISGVLKNHPPEELNNKNISHESIYQYIYEGEGKYEYLWPHLRKAKRKRQKQKARKPQKISIPGRISIHRRPEEINQKKILGHWESDTVEGRRRTKGNLSVQYERKAKLARLNKIKNKSAKETEQALRKSIDSLPLYLWNSITFDNGGESATHLTLRDDYDLETYHCDAYASWQKGGVENLNGLIRQYIPKGSALDDFTDEEIYDIQEKLNNRPRKSLNYLSPNQIIAQETS